MTVDQAADQTCDTGTVQGLSEQIIDRLLSNHPGAVVVASDSRLWYEPRVNMVLQSCAADSLFDALAAGGREMEIISAYRTVAQQVMLYRWYREGRCGITLASQPGDSNHEDGAALDIGDTDYWRPYLTSRGWNWQGSNDPAHYSYRGAGFNSGVGSWGLGAFQQLWNENNPDDLLVVDGQYGQATESALLRSPAEGWQMEPIRIYVNGTEQTEVIRAWLHQGISVMSVADWCRYAGYPPAEWNNDENAVHVSTEKTNAEP